MFLNIFSSSGFQYSPAGQFNWTRTLANSTLQTSNPHVDHTTQTGEGYYMLAQAANQNANDRAQLLTPVQTVTAGSCLHFWYYQHTQSQQMKFNVYLSTQSTILWSHSDSLDNRWLYTEININSADQPWQAVFESEVLGQHPDASIAIDDVMITRGLCPKPGDCTFEKDWCGWTNSKTDREMDWLVGNGQHSLGTGPSYGKFNTGKTDQSSY